MPKQVWGKRAASISETKQDHSIQQDTQLTGKLTYLNCNLLKNSPAVKKDAALFKMTSVKKVVKSKWYRLVAKF